jgi:UDP-N-acetylglucosamine 2-epimerase (non-hydrolysing)
MGQKLKILSIFGTRPEAIKLAPVLRELDNHPERIISQVCITGQHRELLDQALELFDIQPDFDLDIMQANQTPTEVASLTLSKLAPVFQRLAPDWVLVQGDTTTAIAASLAAFYAQVKVGHIEAGLRTQDRWNPFPEEINRKIIGAIANLHFAPTESAKHNLIQEGIHEEDIFVTGNTGIDALLWVLNQQLSTRATMSAIENRVKHGDLKGLDVNKKMILVTAHRRENQGKPLEDICQALKEIAKKYVDEVQIIYPVHLSPAVYEPVNRLLGSVPNIMLIPPVDYFLLVYLMKQAFLILTDSGGIQEEAPALGIPVLVLRNVTERIESLEFGTGCLVGTDSEEIVKRTTKLLEDKAYYKNMAKPNYHYGDGQAAKRVVKILLGEDPSPFIPKTK